jgi:hypothetical protein
VHRPHGCVVHDLAPDPVDSVDHGFHTQIRVKRPGGLAHSSARL